MESITNDAGTPVRRGHPHHRRNHGAVTVAPQNGVLDSESVQKGKSLKRGPAVKVQWHLTCDPSGVSIAGAISNQNAGPAYERPHILLHRTNSVSPAPSPK